MYGDINLAIGQTKGSSKKQRIQLVKIVSYTVLIIVAISSLITFFINLQLSLNSINKQQTQILQSLASNDATAVKLYLLKSRLDDVSAIINNRKKFNDQAKTILSLVPENVTVTSIHIDDNGISVGVDSKSLLDLNNFLNNCLKLETDHKLANLSLGGLNVGSGSYAMTVSMQLQ